MRSQPAAASSYLRRASAASPRAPPVQALDSGHPRTRPTTDRPGRPASTTARASWAAAAAASPAGPSASARASAAAGRLTLAPPESARRGVPRPARTVRRPARTGRRRVPRWRRSWGRRSVCAFTSASRTASSADRGGPAGRAGAHERPGSRPAGPAWSWSPRQRIGKGERGLVITGARPERAGGVDPDGKGAAWQAAQARQWPGARTGPRSALGRNGPAGSAPERGISAISAAVSVSAAAGVSPRPRPASPSTARHRLPRPRPGQPDQACRREARLRTPASAAPRPCVGRERRRRGGDDGAQLIAAPHQAHGSPGRPAGPGPAPRSGPPGPGGPSHAQTSCSSEPEPASPGRIRWHATGTRRPRSGPPTERAWPPRPPVPGSLRAAGRKCEMPGNPGAVAGGSSAVAHPVVQGRGVARPAYTASRSRPCLNPSRPPLRTSSPLSRAASSAAGRAGQAQAHKASCGQAGARHRKQAGQGPGRAAAGRRARPDRRGGGWAAGRAARHSVRTLSTASSGSLSRRLSRRPSAFVVQPEHDDASAAYVASAIARVQLGDCAPPARQVGEQRVQLRARMAGPAGQHEQRGQPGQTGGRCAPVSRRLARSARCASSSAISAGRSAQDHSTRRRTDSKTRSRSSSGAATAGGCSVRPRRTPSSCDSG